VISSFPAEDATRLARYTTLRGPMSTRVGGRPELFRCGGWSVEQGPFSGEWLVE
jgi:hypothetical protein